MLYLYIKYIAGNMYIYMKNLKYQFQSACKFLFGGIGILQEILTLLVRQSTHGRKSNKCKTVYLPIDSDLYTIEQRMAKNVWLLGSKRFDAVSEFLKFSYGFFTF